MDICIYAEIDQYTLVPDQLPLQSPVESYRHRPVIELQSTDIVSSTSPASSGGLYDGDSDHVPVSLFPDTVPLICPP
jgi:hypothetical protein